jgi:phospholipid/cholesterol/gamma-HCH transport system ATP-binding protein
MGMLFLRRLVTFGPREVLLTSDEPVVSQFLGGRREGPIGMSEEKDAATLAAEAAGPRPAGDRAPREIVPQLEPSPGLPPRRAAGRRRERVLGMLDRLPPAARAAVERAYATDGSTPKDGHTLEGGHTLEDGHTLEGGHTPEGDSAPTLPLPTSGSGT